MPGRPTFEAPQALLKCLVCNSGSQQAAINAWSLDTGASV